MSSKKNTQEKYITTLINLQMSLESFHHLKNTPFYQHASRKRMNLLETELENQLKKEGFEEMYMEDEETFAEYIKHVEYISKWVVNSSFKEVLDLGSALNKGQLRFVDK